MVLHYIFFLLNLQLFMHSPEFSEHLCDCYFEILIGKSFLSLSLRTFYEVLFIFSWAHIPISSYSCLSVGFYALAVVPPNLEGVTLFRR